MAATSGDDQKTSLTLGCALTKLNLDVLVCIVSFLDLVSLARLSQTNRFLHTFIDEHGWKALCLGTGVNVQRKEVIVGRDPLTSPSLWYKSLLQVDCAWKHKSFRSYQLRLPLTTTFAARSTKVDRHQPQPLLLLTPLGLYLFTGSEMRLWTCEVLQRLGPVSMKHAQVFYLLNPAGMDNGTEGGSKGASSALWDICACTQVDEAGEYIALGRLNGLVEIIHVSRMLGQKASYRQRAREKRERRAQGREEMMVNLVWIKTTTKTSIQSMHASPSSGLLAVGAKGGSVALFHVDVCGDRVRVRAVDEWNMGSRPWSVWVQGSHWLAVGTNGTEPIVVYLLHSGSCKPIRSVRLSSGGAKAKWTSVYAMESSEAGRLLLAGCYDGTLRQYDVEEVLRGERGEGGAAVMAVPNRYLRDRFDPSAIYCLCSGVGHDGQEVGAGTARHGVCKLFTNTASAREKDSWSVFAAQSSHSPTYSLVGQYDRLFGVSEASFWQIDLRPSTLAPPTPRTDDHHQQQQHTMAYYRHGDMLIEHTRWPT